MRKPLIIFVLVALFIGFSCDTEEPDGIFDPNVEVDPDPVITSISPADSAWSVVQEITISGQNFKNNSIDNYVYFDGKLASIISSSQSELVVKSPNIVGDSILIQIAVSNAYEFAYYDKNYKLKSITEEYGQLDEYDNMKAIACDKDENVYVTADNNVFIVEPDSSKKDFGTLMSIAATAMKVGPLSNLYYCQGIAMFRMLSDGTSDAGWYIIFPDNITDFDFDSDTNIYAGSDKGKIYSVDIANKTNSVLATLDSVNISSVRVFNSYLYVSGYYYGSNSQHITNGVWRYQIVSGTLTNQEEYLNWDEYDDSKINSITFDIDGYMYLSSTGGDCITIYENGTLKPFYQGVIYPNTKKICWGNGKYLYAIRMASDNTSQRLIKINMLKNGAPYYGRQF